MTVPRLALRAPVTGRVPALDELKGIARDAGVAITELACHLQGQLVAVNPVYDSAFDGFAAPAVRGDPKARQKWAVDQVKMTAKAASNLGLKAMPTFTGALLWPFMYPWPQRPAGLVETAFVAVIRAGPFR